MEKKERGGKEKEDADCGDGVYEGAAPGREREGRAQGREEKEQGRDSGDSGGGGEAGGAAERRNVPTRRREGACFDGGR